MFFKNNMALPAVLILIVMAGCTQNPTKPFSQTPKTVKRQRLIMGAVIDVEVPSPQQKQIAPIFSIFSELNQSLSSYLPSSEVSRLNRGETLKPSQHLYQAFLQAINFYKISDGYFDIFVGKKTIKSHENPNLLYLEKIKSKKKKRYHLSKQKISLTSGAKIDLGGVIKGYALDQTVKTLTNNKVHKAKVSASGDSVCLGPCQITLSHPILTSVVMASFTSNSPQLAVSTSGNNKGKSSFSNIVNPKTGKYVDHWLSVTLFSGSNSARLDALSTAVFSMPNQKALRYLKVNKIEYILIDHNKQVHMSGNLGLFTKDFKWLNTKNLQIKKNK